MRRKKQRVPQGSEEVKKPSIQHGYKKSLDIPEDEYLEDQPPSKRGHP